MARMRLKASLREKWGDQGQVLQLIEKVDSKREKIWSHGGLDSSLHALAGFNGEGVGMDTGWVKGIENVV
jgi:hypothetical protein